MENKRYNLVNNVLGWLCFAIAAVTYLLTIEPTASFWDCPEFIVQGAKLEVGHPPGNPIFMLAARFFVTLFGGEMSTAAVAVNSMSALLSAATILLLFWSITHLARKLMIKDGEAPQLWQTIVIMAAGLCGALAYTWSDTFWFSAVEGEVYAFSSFCTALVFWLMLKWENRADEPGSDRYLVLIAYVIGVSIAVHLLNLLCIPALCLIYYYRKFKNVNAVGSLIALGVSVVLVGAILYGLVPGIVQMAQWFELLCVNTLGMSYNMGVLLYAILLLATFVLALVSIYDQHTFGLAKALTVLSIILAGIPFIGHSVVLGILISIGLFVLIYALGKKITRRLMAMTVLSVMVMFIGYSSYALLLIRATADTPMNQNSPDNVFALASYLNREQYGDRPLFLGPTFAEKLRETEYPEGSGNYYVEVDDYGYPLTTTLDGYLRNSDGGAVSTTDHIYTKVVKSSPDEPDRYVDEVTRPNYKTMPDLNMLFPRIYSTDPAHVPSYKSWAGYHISDFDNIPREIRQQWAQQGFVPRMELMRYLPGMEPVTTYVNTATGQPAVREMAWKPGFGTNMRYFVNYQLNHMYWRYFMWNFAGRQNDLQGNGEPHLGNWISGIPAIDNARLGDQSLLPDEFGKGNKGHNVFYMLPLLLGVFGLLMQALYRGWANEGRGIEQFWVVFFLFFMTGLAIVLYLNQTPGQPRERDYAYAGSFYAFTIWIGLAIPALAVLLHKWLAKGKASKEISAGIAGIVTIVALAVPLQMVSQTWDDHDRSNRYTTRDFGFNYLSSLDPDAIIFTNGDNDTFPLWYAQEVEGYRTDVRVVNLSYLTTDWYATQQTQPAYEAAPVPMLATPRDWRYERLAYSFIAPANMAPTNVFDALDSLYKSDPRLVGAPYMTSPNVYIPVDRQAALEHYGTGAAIFDSLYVEPFIEDVTVDLTQQGNGMNQSKVLSLDMIANSITGGWQRPVYFATTVPSRYYLGLTPFMSATGLANEVTGVRQRGIYNVTAQKSFANIMSKYRWGGIDEHGSELYLDETIRRMVSSIRSGIYTIAENLMLMPDVPASAEAQNAAIQAGYVKPSTQAEMARILLDLIGRKLPAEASPYDTMMGLYIARMYYDLYMQTGNEADLQACYDLARREADRYAQYITYGTTLLPSERRAFSRSEGYAFCYLAEAVALANRAEIFLRDPGLRNEPEAADDMLNIKDLDVQEDWIIAPMIYINGYSAEELGAELENFSPEDQATIRRAISLLKLHALAGTDPMALSNELMGAHGFTAGDWSRLHSDAYAH